MLKYYLLLGVVATLGRADSEAMEEETDNYDEDHTYHSIEAGIEPENGDPAASDFVRAAVRRRHLVLH